jgi:hypothetical protein
MTEPLAIVFQQRAIREVEDIDPWWRQNRPAAPDLFRAELELMLRGGTPTGRAQTNGGGIFRA